MTSPETVSEKIHALITGDGPTNTRDQAIVAVVELHPPSVLSAAILPERFGEGRCVYCHHPLIREYRGHLNGAAQLSTMHDHVDPQPWCLTCHSESEEDGYAPYPCETVRVIAEALGCAP